ncbi:MAG: SDR family oxidoreductase [Gammaproteobacteria bacterium]|nr:MAG: SDR family oxidoreductase [Gammaproteobacteria bacterium]
MPTVLITGANRGLGLEFVSQYLAEGWEVIACVRQPSAALSGLQAHGPLTIHQLDLVDPAALAELAASLGDRPLDVLLNNAGTMGRGSFAEEGLTPFRFGTSDAGEWAEVFHLNVFVPMKLAELLVDNVAASEWRRIVTLTSMLGSMELNTLGGLYAYRASKAAVNAMMRSMAIDLGPKGIIAAPIHPGWVKTGLGGDNAPLEAPEAVAGVRSVIASLTPENAGRVLSYAGEAMPW